MKPRRLRYWVAGGLCAVAVGALLVGGLSKNVVYFRTVSEAIRERPHEGDNRLRLAGAVVPGSVERRSEGVAFQVTDGNATAAVFHRGDPPELFGDRAPVVCEGRWRGTTFSSDRLLIKHGAEYSPPKVDVTSGGAPR